VERIFGIREIQQVGQKTPVIRNNQLSQVRTCSRSRFSYNACDISICQYLTVAAAATDDFPLLANVLAGCRIEDCTGHPIDHDGLATEGGTDIALARPQIFVV
jgi:hypothetical protein